VSFAAAALTWRRLGVPFYDWLGFLFLVAVSHGLLDALTDGGLGVAFFAPFDGRRYFFPWRPIEVSPIGLGFFSARGARTFLSELQWVWLPTGALVGAVEAVRWLRARGARRRVGGV
jgi:inner membrane protein